MKKFLPMTFILIIFTLFSAACAPTNRAANPAPPDVSATQAASTKGLSDTARGSCTTDGCVEAKNLAERIIRDNDPAHVEYVYIISPYTGKIIIQGVAVGKVSSTTKRLDEPYTYILSPMNQCGEIGTGCAHWLQVSKAGSDGTWGDSTPDIFWFDTAGIKYEVKVGGAMVFTTEVPYIFANDTINTKVDIRVQTDQVDPNALALRNRIIAWLKANPSWNPGDQIPLNVITGEQ